MPPKRVSDAELITAADRCGGDPGKVAESLGLSSVSNVARRLKRIRWQPGQAPPVDQGEPPDDRRVLHRILGELARQGYERGLSEDALDRIYSAQRDIIQAFGYPRPSH